APQLPRHPRLHQSRLHRAVRPARPQGVEAGEGDSRRIAEAARRACVARTATRFHDVSGGSAAMLRRIVFIVFAVFGFVGAAVADDIAPTGTLRAVYLAGNPAQAVQDRATGSIRGVAADLARELGRRIGAPVEITPVADPKAVIDAVAGGRADIGFVAYAPSRGGTVEFSQTYM